MAFVRTEMVRPHVTVVTLDNPSRLNSLSFALVEDLYGPWPPWPRTTTAGSWS